MKGNFETCLREVLRHEGGWSNHSEDPGGITNLGVTKATYEDWVGHPVTEKIMRGLTVENVKPLYKTKYWDALRCDDLPYGVDLCVFDFGVNAGPNRAVRYLQRMIGAKEDGILGPHSLSLMNQFVRERGKIEAVTIYQDMRREYYKLLKTFPTFGKGWMKRVRDIEMVAIILAKRAP